MLWKPIEIAPQDGTPVLLFYKNNSFGLPRIIIARYIPKGTECFCSDDCECKYDEEKDLYLAQEGWYEQIDNWGDYSEVFVGEGEPTHWMPLPESPILDQNVPNVMWQQSTEE